MLCIYVLRSQKGLARYHFVISCYDYFEKVLSSEFYYYGSLADYVIDMSNCETYVLLWVWLAHDICWNLNAGFSCLQQQEQTEFVKVFIYHFQFINWIAWGQAKVYAWGVDTSPTYLLFQTLLPLFWTLTCMIWMKLTRTDVVFSRTTMMLFYV